MIKVYYLCFCCLGAWAWALAADEEAALLGAAGGWARPYGSDEGRGVAPVVCTPWSTRDVLSTHEEINIGNVALP